MEKNCIICNEEMGSHFNHLRKHNLSKRMYYDSYYKGLSEGKCIVCGENTNFLSLKNRYSFYCSSKCSINKAKNFSLENKKKRKELVKIDYDKIKNFNDGVCIICNKPTKFIYSEKKYLMTCSNKSCIQKSLHFRMPILNINDFKIQDFNDGIKCPYCLKQFIKSSFKSSIFALSYHLNMHSVNGEQDGMRKLIYDTFIDKNIKICCICNKEERIFKNMIVGYEKYCIKCIKTKRFYEMVRINRLGEDIIVKKNLLTKEELKKIYENRGKKISESKLKFYKTNDGINVKKIIGEKNKKALKLFYSTDKGKINAKIVGKKISKIMKEKILNGIFTPKITNSLTRKNYQFQVNNKLHYFRSSWEVKVFNYLINKYGEENVYYEKHRIPYFSQKYQRERIYLVDFSVKINLGYLLIEVKPESKIMDNIDKINSAKDFCKKNDYEFKIFSEEELKCLN